MQAFTSAVQHLSWACHEPSVKTFDLSDSLDVVRVELEALLRAFTVMEATFVTR